MPLYGPGSRVTVEQDRALLSSRDLGLRSDLADHFCAAVYHAVTPLADLLEAEQGLLSGHPLSVLNVKPETARVLSSIIQNAIWNEEKRTGEKAPEQWYEEMDRLIAGALGFERGCRVNILRSVEI